MLPRQQDAKSVSGTVSKGQVKNMDTAETNLNVNTETTRTRTLDQSRAR